MNLDKLGKKDTVLAAILKQHQQWAAIAKIIKARLPQNLAEHYRLACVNNGKLMLVADNSMVANRLKMLIPNLLPEFEPYIGQITKVVVKIDPKQEENQHNSLKPSAVCLVNFEQTAQRLSKFPELAASMQKFVDKHK